MPNTPHLAARAPPNTARGMGKGKVAIAVAIAVVISKLRWQLRSQLGVLSIARASHACNVRVSPWVWGADSRRAELLPGLTPPARTPAAQISLQLVTRASLEKMAYPSLGQL